jgi:hypothetical protein
VPKLKNLFIFEGVLILLAFFYYLFFANKGLVFFDEGVFVHSAERILQGQLPYKDFWLQYGPTYFYVLAFFYKVFGPSILIGRFLSISICLAILACTFAILNKLKITAYKTVTLSFLALVSFGYPLINIPNIIWANVLLALLLVIAYLYWEEKKRLRLVFVIGILLALSLSCKQNLGIVYILLFNLFFLFKKGSSFGKKMTNFLILNITLVAATFVWIYYFFLRQTPLILSGFINFSKSFVSQNAFSYPPLTMLFQPLGIFKLLPYYLPIVLLFTTVYFLFKKNAGLRILLLPLVCLTGFFVTVFPQSDLLHCYPFLGLVMVSLLILFPKSKINMLIIFVAILTGFYLTFFTKMYRYERYLFETDTYLNLPRTQGIMVSKADAKSILAVTNFIAKNTHQNDYVFVYPSASLLYFILDRQNPSKDQIYYPRSWHFSDDQTILSEVKNKQVKYIITHRGYISDSLLSHFIQKQKLILASGEFKIFQIAN